MKKKNILFTAGIMVVATVLAKGCGLVRDMLLARYFGTGAAAQAFAAASSLPTLFFDFALGAAVSSTFIPVFNHMLEKEGKEQAETFASQFINLIFLVTSGLAVLGILFSDKLMYLIAPGLSAEVHDMAVSLSNIMFPMVIFIGLAFSFVGILQSYGEFNIPAIISLVSNGAIIIYFLIFGSGYGVTGVAVAVLVGWSLQMLIQLPPLIKLGYKHKADFNFRSKGIISSLTLALPILISTWVQPICSSVNTVLSSYLETDALAAMNFANRFYIIIVGVFSFVTTNLIFPHISRLNAAENKSEVRAVVNSSVGILGVIIIPIMMLIIPLASNLVSFIYEGGEFGNNSVRLMSGALSCLSFGMIGFAVQEVLYKVFYSMKDSKTPMITSISGIALNVGLASLLVKFMGINGLALAAASAPTFIAVLLVFIIRKREPGIMDRATIVNILKIMVSGGVMLTAVYIVKHFGSIPLCINEPGKLNHFTLLLTCSFAGVLAYTVSVCLFKVKEVVFIKDKLFELRKRFFERGA